MPKRSSDPKKNSRQESRANEKPQTVQPIESPLAGLSWAISLTITFASLIVFSYLAFRHEGTTIRGNELSQDRAFFTVINAATLTGFQTTWPGYNEFFLPGKIVTAILTLGGTLFCLIVGGMAAKRILRMPFSDRQVTIASVVFTIAAMFIGGLPLVTKNFAKSPIDPFFNALSAFANSGLFAGKLPDEFDWRTHTILMPLAILGGLGLPVLLEIFSHTTGSRLSRHAMRVLISTAIVYLLGTAVLFGCSLHEKYEAKLTANESGAPDPTLNYSDYRDAAAISSLQANNARGPGFAFQFATELPRITQWAIIALMLVGGAGPAGTAGGIKSSTLAEFFRGIYRSLRGAPAGRLFGIACVFLVLYIADILTCFLMLLVFEPHVPTERLLFLSISAAGNIGLSHEPVSIVGEGLYVLSATMLIGRFLPLVILWWTTLTTNDSDVAIG